jgi:hypothetical protein
VLGIVFYDSEPFRGFGEVKRVNGKAVCARGDVSFDGMTDGRITITVVCGFKDGRDIAEYAVRMLSTAAAPCTSPDSSDAPKPEPPQD